VANNRDLERRVETRKLKVAAGATLLNILLKYKKNEFFIFLGNEEKRRARERANGVGIEKACYEKERRASLYY
jgi:hypothetical protein